MAQDPAFLMYSKDWLTATAEYLPEEKGVYIDLLCYQHRNGNLPNDLTRLARMVGLSLSDFEPIWKIISKHFYMENERLFNRKLSEVMSERAEKGKKNTIIGTFASILRLGNYDKKTYAHLKKSFKADDFMQYEKEDITERLTDWLHERLKSIGDGNVNIYNEEEELNIKEEKISNLSFDEFWDLYDKKVGKDDVIKLYEKISETDRQKIKDYIPKYKDHQPEKKYRKDPIRFLRHKTWQDEIAETGFTLFTQKQDEDERE